MTSLIQALLGNFFQSRTTLAGSQNHTRSWQIISICQIHLSTESWALDSNWKLFTLEVWTGFVQLPEVLSLPTDRCMSGGLQGFFGQKKPSPQVSWSFEPCSGSFCVFWVLAEQGSSNKAKILSLNGPFFSCHLLTALRSHFLSLEAGSDTLCDFRSDFTHFTPLPQTGSKLCLHINR